MDLDTLRSHLDVDERLATYSGGTGSWDAVAPDVHGEQYRVIERNGAGGAQFPVARATGPRRAEHIARHDPARTLRWVAAARKVLELHASAPWPPPHHGPAEKSVCTECGRDREFVEDWPCPTVSALMSIYEEAP